MAPDKKHEGSKSSPPVRSEKKKPPPPDRKLEKTIELGGREKDGKQTLDLR